MDPVEISRARCFNIEEAQAILPVIYRITENYSVQVHELIERLEKFNGHDSSVMADLEGQVNHLISTWQVKLQKLGAQPKGLWIADFDAGDGYFCWKYPEAQIEYWHAYNDGFTKRVHISERIPQSIPSEPPQAEL